MFSRIHRSTVFRVTRINLQTHTHTLSFNNHYNVIFEPTSRFSNLFLPFRLSNQYFVCNLYFSCSPHQFRNLFEPSHICVNRNGQKVKAYISISSEARSTNLTLLTVPSCVASSVGILSFCGLTMHLQTYTRIHGREFSRNLKKSPRHCLSTRITSSNKAT